MEKLWNETCRMVERFRKTGASGQDFRAAVVKVFEQLGWSKEDDIALDLEIPIGATKSVNPDIVVSNDGVNRYVVELKRPSAQIKNRDAEQLFSYMRLLQLDFGLLIGEFLRFYYDDPSDTKHPVLIAEVPFQQNDEEGIEIFKLFSKRGFDVFGLTHYCEAVMTERKRQNRIKGIANTMCSLKGKRFIRDVVRAQLQKQYPSDIVRDVMRRIDISAFLRDPADADKTEDEAMIEAATNATYVSGEAVDESAASPTGVNVEATIIEHPVEAPESLVSAGEGMPAQGEAAPMAGQPVPSGAMGAYPMQAAMPGWGMSVQGVPGQQSQFQGSVQPQVQQPAEASFQTSAGSEVPMDFQPQPYAQSPMEPQPQERPIEYRPAYQPRSSVQPVQPHGQSGEPNIQSMEPMPQQPLNQPAEQPMMQPMEHSAAESFGAPMEQPMGQPFIPSISPYPADDFKSSEEA